MEITRLVKGEEEGCRCFYRTYGIADAKYV